MTPHGDPHHQSAIAGAKRDRGKHRGAGSLPFGGANSRRATELPHGDASPELQPLPNSSPPDRRKSSPPLLSLPNCEMDATPSQMVATNPVEDAPGSTWGVSGRTWHKKVLWIERDLTSHTRPMQDSAGRLGKIVFLLEILQITKPIDMENPGKLSVQVQSYESKQKLPQSTQMSLGDICNSFELFVFHSSFNLYF